ncbi:MAG: phosphoribosylamine--glycine ligase [Gammaproteobacteria bacterium]
MKILIVGNGGREHALAWKVAQSPHVSQVFVAPGNAGTALQAKTQNVPIAVTDVKALTDFARTQAIDLVIIGPEAALAAGVTDAFIPLGIKCFGPTQAAARLESSKVFSKAFMIRHHIPTARYASFQALEPTLNYLQQQTFPVVIKADGLAAGKGVVIAQTYEEAATTVNEMLNGQAFGNAGQQLIIEEFLTGEEASFIVMTDGEHILSLASSQDHKARDDGDRGPNTGGMGAYSPAPVITPELEQRILHDIIKPTLQGMLVEGCPYRGFLYAGLMITPDGQPKVLEFNCRLGDPETQPLLMRLKTDLVDLCLATLEGKLGNAQAEWDSRAALGVVMAAEGYPNIYPTGEVIHGLPSVLPADCQIFHAGTQQQNDQVVTAGGRVLCVTALGETFAAAQAKAYQWLKTIHWQHMHYRTDIGYRAVAREAIRQP